ncbi:DEAH box RNA helicase DHR1 [Hyphodiscus hymeniophilus]|uniref:RNA helicase n=1 Tax=Hyphodiscus hymeniophilus TaxID=353542 RepID=A0A9P7AW81_9HELO|nr:DEAH box RNA helicase DHR1 [Hyphodiscus hymeniophilus]
MPKFVPRQRKHKVLARTKSRSYTTEPIDSNAVEHLPAVKADIEEKKRQLKEELRKEGTKISGKKAKRLEKYIETKLRKDENKELIQKLASNTTDTSLYSSSRKLGQGKETKRERLGRALRDHQAGINLDGDNEEILFEKRTVREAEAQSEDEDDEETIKGLFHGTASMKTQPTTHSAGGGLKRPLEVDEEGNPVLKRRKRRGGVNSKVSFKHETPEEPEWEGFSSESEMDSNSDSEARGTENGTDSSDESAGEEQMSLNTKSIAASQEQEDDEDDEESSEESDESGEESDESGEVPAQKQRSSAFKAWANQQLHEAIGYEPATATPNATETPKIAGFQPRAPEQDPLPLELQPTSNDSRKAFSVLVTRPPDVQAARTQLPVVGEEQKIMEAIHNNDLVVIYGATGSGKTTQVPQFLFEAGYGSPDSPTPGLIGITQPRRVAAVSMAKRVGDELGDHGKNVAYQIRFEGSVSTQTAIKFMTDGVLLREVARDIALRKYSAIIIDEAHERSVNTDILIGMLSRVVKLRQEMALEDPSIKPLKLIIMSATLRITDFTQNSTLFPKPPPVLQAEGRQYPVTMHFARKTHHDYVEEIFGKISKGHKKLPPGGFLIFLTGQNEITHLSKKLKEAFHIGQSATGPHVRVSGKDTPIETEDIEFGDTIDDSKDDYDDDDDDEVDINVNDDEFEIGEESETGPGRMHVLPLYSLLPTREQLRVFEPPPDGSRLVVLATNVAETSLTIPGIRYVFDCGRSKERKYDRTTGVQSFEVGWISKASANQRAGRAGRTGPGHCYKLYSSAVYERDFKDFAEPEILRMPIEGVVLQLKAMNLQHVVNFPFPTPPDRQSLANSEKLLTYLSAISPNGQITSIGSTMSIFPLSPRFARILLVGHVNNCLPYTVALVAGLSAADVFIPENQVIPAVAIAPKVDGDYLTNAERIEEEARSNKRRHFNRIQKIFCSTDDRSDAIKLLQVVAEFAHEPTEAWCQSHYVRFKVLKEIQQLRRQITELLRTNIAAFSSLKYQDKLDQPTAKQVKTLKQVIAAGFLDHVAIRANLAPNPPEEHRKPTRAIDVPYLTLFPSNTSQVDEDKAVYIHPSSPLAHLSTQECPEYVVYSYLQRVSSTVSGKIPKTRMTALTDIPGSQLAALAKGTPLLYYGKPIKEIKSAAVSDSGSVRECWVIPYLRPEGSGAIGWPLPARKVVQKKIPGRGWVVE